MPTLLRSCCLILLATGLVRIAAAQNDPFGDAADSVFDDLDVGSIASGPGALFPSPAATGAQPAGTPAGQGEAEEPPGPLVIQLLEHSVRGNDQFAMAVHSLARIGRWKEVDQLLTPLAGRGLSEAQQAEMAATIGAATLLRISMNQDISDQARQAARTLSVAAKKQAESPDRLRAAIADLGSDSVDTRLQATRTLLSGGNAAIEALVAAAVSSSPPAARDDILRVMLRLGNGGPQALRQLTLYGEPNVRLHALESLVRIKRTAALTELLTALYATDSSDEERAFASAALQQLSAAVPSRAETVASFFQQLKLHQQIAEQASNDERIVIRWSVDADGTRVTYQPMRRIFAVYRDVADSVWRLQRIGELSPEISRSLLAADLSYRLLVDPDWGDPEQIQQLQQMYGPALQGVAMTTAIEDALSQNNIPALVGLIRSIGADATAADRNAYLRFTGPKPTALVAVASAPDPRVRYEAALAISRLAGTTPYAGSSEVKRTLAEMQRLKELPTAILVETRPEVIVHQEGLLGQLGMSVDVVGSVGQLQRRLARGGDIRLILSKTELPDFSAIEMIDLVRRTPRGSEIPLVFYGADVVGLSSGRWPGVIEQIDRPATTAAFSAILRQIEQARRLPPLTVLDRRLYAEAATN